MHGTWQAEATGGRWRAQVQSSSSEAREVCPSGYRLQPWVSVVREAQIEPGHRCADEEFSLSGWRLTLDKAVSSLVPSQVTIIRIDGDPFETAYLFRIRFFQE
jgi:hypothetical protein